MHHPITIKACTNAPCLTAVSDSADCPALALPPWWYPYPEPYPRYALHWKVVGADVRLLAETTAPDGYIAVGWPSNQP
jgi:hypothetical protein